MTKKVAIILVTVIIAQALAQMPASASSIGNVAAASALLIEKDTGTILYEQDIYKRHPADSFARIMTLLLAAEAVESLVISDHELVEMTETAWFDIDENSTTQSIQPGQMMTFIDLIHCAYVGSANEACNMIALRLAGSVAAFVRTMNEKAVQLGCSDTNFVNPHGQYHDNQYTNAYDMYILYNEALKSGLFSEIAGTFRHVTERTDETESRTLTSTNSLLNQSSIYYYRYCQSGIGSNSYEGGYSLVASAEENNLSLIAVVLGTREVINDDESVTMRHFTETHRLFMWGYDNYAWRDILKESDLLARVPVEDGSGADFVNVRPAWSLTLLLDNSISTESFDFDITIFSEQNETPVAAPVNAGDKLGEVVVSRNGVVYDTIPLLANTKVELASMVYFMRQISEVLATPLARAIIVSLIFIVVIYAALVIRYNIMRINRLRRIRNAKNEIIQDRQDIFK